MCQIPTAGTGGQAEHVGAGAQEVHEPERFVPSDVLLARGHSMILTILKYYV